MKPAPGSVGSATREPRRTPAARSRRDSALARTHLALVGRGRVVELRPWLFRCVRNACLSELDRAATRRCGELGVEWSPADVDSDPEWRAEYGDRVPVILIDGDEHGYWTVEEDRLRQALSDV